MPPPRNKNRHKKPIPADVDPRTQVLAQLYRIGPLELLELADQDFIDIAQRAVSAGVMHGPADTYEEAFTLVNNFRIEHNVE
jgi:hypothetical protein